MSGSALSAHLTIVFIAMMSAVICQNHPNLDRIAAANQSTFTVAQTSQAKVEINPRGQLDQWAAWI